MAQKLTNFKTITENKLFKNHLEAQFPDFISWQNYLSSMTSTNNENQWTQDAVKIAESIQSVVTETESICNTQMSNFKKLNNSEPALVNTQEEVSPLEKKGGTGVNVIGLKTLQQYAKVNFLAAVYFAYEFNEAIISKPAFQQAEIDTETNLKQDEIANKAADNQYLKVDTLYKSLVPQLQAKYQKICDEINQIISSNVAASNFTSQQEEDLASLIDYINNYASNEEEILEVNINQEKMENKKQSSKNNVVIYKGTLGEIQKFYKDYTKFCEVFIAFFLSMVLPVYIAPMITYNHPKIDTMLGISIPMAFFLGIATGGNDISNSQGPVYGSKTLTMPWVLFLGSLFNFIGAIALGDKVSKTISSKILEMDEFEGKEYYYALSMLAVLGSSTFSCMTITVFGIPISITKDVIFSLASVGLCAVGWSGISGTGILKVSLAMLTSPLVGTIVAVIMNGCMCWFVIKSKNPIARSRASLPIFGFFNIFFIVFLTCLKGFKVKPIYWCAVIGSGCGLLCAIILLAYTAKKKITKDADDKYSSGTKHREAYNDEQIAVIFKPLLIISACAMAFTHGANDVGNSIGPLVGILNVYHGRGVADVEIPFWTLVMGGIAFAIGISTMGHRTIKTMGEKVTTLNPMKACTIQMGAACAILTATVLEMPVSTSHCAVGAVLGSTLAERVFGMPYFFKKGMFAKIAGSWFYTIPLGISLTVYFYYGILGAFE